VTASVATGMAASELRFGAGLDRRTLAVMMPIGPLAVAVVLGIPPYRTTDSNAVIRAAREAG